MTDTSAPAEHLIPVNVAVDACAELIGITVTLHQQYIDLAQAAMPHLPAGAQAILAANVARVGREQFVARPKSWRGSPRRQPSR